MSQLAIMLQRGPIVINKVLPIVIQSFYIFLQVINFLHSISFYAIHIVPSILITFQHSSIEGIKYWQETLVICQAAPREKQGVDCLVLDLVKSAIIQ